MVSEPGIMQAKWCSRMSTEHNGGSINHEKVEEKSMAGEEKAALQQAYW